MPSAVPKRSVWDLDDMFFLSQNHLILLSLLCFFNFTVVVIHLNTKIIGNEKEDGRIEGDRKRWGSGWNRGERRSGTPKGGVPDARRPQRTMG